MPNTVRWVHGNIVEVEAGDERPVKIIRRGWGTHFLLRDTPELYWFHFPIPTLASVNNVHLRLTKIYVLFDTDGTEVEELHVYDGRVDVKIFKDLQVTGNHSVNIDPSNCWVLDPAIEITKGVGLSVGVRVSQGGQRGFPEILFTTAGAEFDSP